MAGGFQADILSDKLQKKRERSNEFIPTGISPSDCGQIRRNQVRSLQQTY